ncbi:MAG TPA: carbon starvation CstA family protein, partial [Pyrinomonadaceae bacterium]
MSLTLLAIGFVALLVVGYRLYGGWVARQFRLDDGRRTPAHEVNDGEDFVPTKPFYLFGQHFSAIAAAGPIAGPILACQAFGWLPCLLWIGLGVVLIGAVHDFTSLAASVRHGATSVAEITREHLGNKAGRAMMAFIWIALIYVIVAFADITAGTFVGGSEELKAAAVNFNPGGAVAAASVLYLLLSVVLGLVQRYLNPPLWLVTLIFVPAAFALSWVGTQMSTTFVMSHKAWGVLILVYCCVASMVPVWALLQPRGYLGGFILYAAIALGIIGVFFGGYEIRQPAFKSWDVGGMTGMLFPFLFVTIACGACSGFHGLVCSGTTSKQVERESHIRPVGYGAMLAEGFVALIALVTVMIAAEGALKGKAPGTIYGGGIGQFLTLIIGRENLAVATTFGAMAFSTFVFDTLDVSTRLGRYIVQELLGSRGRAGAVAGTLL